MRTRPGPDLQFQPLARIVLAFSIENPAKATARGQMAYSIQMPPMDYQNNMGGTLYFCHQQRKHRKVRKSA